jgi:cytidylate kinase
MPNIIAIDGPAGSGKSTIGKKLADRLGFVFFDTGVLYRAIACAALQRRLDPADETAITALAETANIAVQPPSAADGRDNDLIVDGTDLTWAIRTPAVDACVSVVAAYAGVRRALVEQQRRIGRRGRVVMVGRDIGTVILPEADVKIYLDASPGERARRRHAERLSRGEDAVYEDVLASVVARDQLDSNRSVAPLRPADDAILIDSDGLTVEGVLARIAPLLEV